MGGLVSIEQLVSGRMDALASAYQGATKTAAVYALYAHLCEDLAVARVLHAYGYITQAGFDKIVAHAEVFLSRNGLNRRRSCRPEPS